MRRIKLMVVILSLHSLVQCVAKPCRHRVRTPTKCHKERSCRFRAQLTTHKNSTKYYCCNDGFESVNNECVDINECSFHVRPCVDVCVNHPGTYSCECHPGYHYIESTNSCVKVDSCDRLNCSQTCRYSDEWGPRCECRRGFELTRGRECVVRKNAACSTGYHREEFSNECLVMGEKPQMIFASSIDVFAYVLREEAELRKFAHVDGKVNSVYYDAVLRLAYIGGEKLTVYNLSTSEAGRVQVALRNAAIDVAVDYIDQRVYVLDDSSLSLWAAKDGKLTPLGTLLEHGASIGALSIDPVTRSLFYASSGRVFRTQLDGRQNQSIVFTLYEHIEQNVTSEALAIDNTDLNEPYVYYAVSRNIFCFDLRGANVDWITGSLQADVNSLDVFEGNIYYTMVDRDGIHARTKDGLREPMTYMLGEKAYALYVSHPYRQVVDRSLACTKPCEHLCFREPNQFNKLLSRCQCSLGFTLAEDKTSCVPTATTDALTPPPLTESLEAPAEYSAFIVAGSIVVLCLCFVQTVLVWWFYPRKRHPHGISGQYAVRFNGGENSSSTTALDSFKLFADN